MRKTPLFAMFLALFLAQPVMAQTTTVEIAVDGKASQVSAHLVLREDGGEVTQMVDFCMDNRRD